MNDYFKIDKEIAKIKIIYKNKAGCCISFIIVDDAKTKEYIKTTISSMDTNTLIDDKIVNYNFGEDIEEGKNNVKKFQNLCREKGNLVIATGIGKYAEYLVKKGQIPNIKTFYQGAFSLPRDSFYLTNNIRLILLVNESEMKEFRSPVADDFTSYASIKIDINEILKEDKLQELDER